MAYINKVSAVAAVLFVAVAIASGLAEAEPQAFPKMDPICATVMPDLLEKCFTTVRVTPTEECCGDLKAATTTQVTCLCDNYIANPAVINITGSYSARITTKCGVFDKYSCDGTSKGGKEKKEDGSSSQNTTSTSNGSKTDNTGGATKTIAVSMSVFGLVASMFIAMF